MLAGVQAGLEYTVIGDTVNTAARLADAAAVGAIYAGNRTVGTTGSVASWRTLRPLRLKGKREPVETSALAMSIFGMASSTSLKLDHDTSNHVPSFRRKPESTAVTPAGAECRGDVSMLRSGEVLG